MIASKPFEDDPQLTARAASGRIHLNFLDGIRGLAALYVALYHCRMLVMEHHRGGWHSSLFAHLTNWMGYGHLSVDVFIVLSGFVLMLPVARSADAKLSGGLRGFAIRRFRRIFPPYYAALLFATGLVLVGTRLHLMHSKQDLSAGAFFSHLFMVQNFSEQWSRQIDGPMWSVATEWDIYVIFALLLLPLWRKFGMLATTVIAFVLGLAPHFMLPDGRNFDWAYPWFLGLFAFGMWGAVACFGSRDARKGLASKRGWGIAAAVGAIGVVVLATVLPMGTGTIGVQMRFLVDMLVGAVTIALIINCTQQSASGTSSSILRLLSHRSVVKLGAFSYSLYLIHQVLISSIVNVLDKRLTEVHEFIAVLLCMPVVLACTYVFYLLFEKPFVAKITKSNAGS